MTTETHNFYERVYTVVRQIPYGRVTSYGAIAKFLGAARSARMVGYAMNGSHAKDVPAHRVVNRIGVLTGKNFFSTPTMMQEKLESEGIKVSADRILDFENAFWDPMKELL